MTIEEEIVVRTSGMLTTIRKLEKETDQLNRELSVALGMLRRVAEERDDWRNVADLLAADLDHIDVMCYKLSDEQIVSLTKFKELEKKYPI